MEKSLRHFVLKEESKVVISCSSNYLALCSKRIISKQAEIVNFPDNCCEKAVNFARKENISSPRRIHAKLKVLTQ